MGGFLSGCLDLVDQRPPVSEETSLDYGMGSAFSIRSPGGGHGDPLQDSHLENPMDRGAWAGYRPRGPKQSDTIE